MSEHIQIDVADRIQTIRIQRPDKKNALTSAMYSALHEGLRAADANAEVRAVILTGGGDCFTAGNDIVDFLQAPATGADSPVARFLRTLHEMQKPLIAAVNGLAIGVGVTLLLHCDLVYAADSAQLQMPFTSLGLCPEAASSYLLPRRVGQARAAELLLLGEMFSASTAREYGLVNAVVPAAEVYPLARSKAQRLAALPPQAVRTTKQLLKRPIQDAAWASLQHELGVFGGLLRGAEAREAMTAFTEKRKPDFSRFS